MTYRFYQVLAATNSPIKALAESTPSAAMLGGIYMEAVVAEQLGFTPYVPDGYEYTDEIREMYAVQAKRVSDSLKYTWEREDDHPLTYQPTLFWPQQMQEGPQRAEGHPDFGFLTSHHLLDLKTTDYPTEEWCDKYLHSVQMCAYMAAYQRQYGTPCMFTIILASRLVQPDPVKFNKDGTVSLSGQNADHFSLKEAVEGMGSKADERHWALAFKAPVWEPYIHKTISYAQCEELAKVGAIFLDAGLAILDTGLSDIVVRPFA